MNSRDRHKEIVRENETPELSLSETLRFEDLGDMFIDLILFLDQLLDLLTRGLHAR
jgi:hypothetical protein